MIDFPHKPSKSSGPGVISVSGAHLTRALQEYRLQTGVMQMQDAKAIYAMQQIAELHEHGILSTAKTLAFMDALDKTVTFTGPINEIWLASLRQQAESFADHIHKILRIGAMNIGLEADRTLYLPELPPHRPGLFIRILTGIVGGRS
jgi:hypothetical protein